MHASKEKVIVSALFLLFSVSIGSSALDIETFDEGLDKNVVSPNSQVAQLVKVTDAQDEMVNESVLLNASGNEFQYYYQDNWTDMTHLKQGYYYALFDSGSSVSNIQYRIIDQSPGGDNTEEFETLSQGQLDINIQNNFTGRYEAGEEVTVEAEVENLGEFYSVDRTDENLIITDNGGDGSFSKTKDTLLAGYPPNDGQELTNTNQWKETDHVVAMSDSNTGDDWDPGSDIILLDYNDGGTVSTEPDETINSGDDEAINTEAGDELNGLDTVSDDIHFASSDSSLDSGDPILYDNDSDGMYTANPDQIIAGNEPSEGVNVTYTDSIPSRMMIASYDENTDGGAWDSAEDLLIYDKDNDSIFTDQEDQIMLGSNPPEAADLNTSHVQQWNDGSPTTPREDDIEILNVGDDSWDSSEDGIWLESGDTNGFQSGEDTLIAGNPAEDVDPNGVDDLFDQWPNISAYDRNSGDTGFDPAADAIIRDYNQGGTYSENTDQIIAGSVAPGSSFTGGSTFTSDNGFPDAWELDVIESIEGGEWKPTQDTILIDRNDGGTYSPEHDQIINSGESNTASAGTGLHKLNSVPDSDKRWADVDDNSKYDSGDEIFLDKDQDGQYTSQADEHLAGLSMDIAGSGKSLDKLNLWQETPGDQTPILFYDWFEGDEFDPSFDSIIHDLDQDSVYTGESDLIIEGDSSMADPGDSISQTDVSNVSIPDTYAMITSGSNSSGTIELGRDESGLYTGELKIPEVYGSELVINVWSETPVSGLRGMESKVISTRTKGIGFDTEETSLEFDVQKKGQYEKEITVNNLLEDSNSIRINSSDSIRNITSHDSSVDLEPDGSKTVNVTFDMESLQDREGDIVLTEQETNISEKVDVQINSPDCIKETSGLCLTSPSTLDIQTSERENLTRTIETLVIAEEGTDVEPGLSAEGNISEYIELPNTTSYSDEFNFDVNIQANTPGNYTGNIVVDTGGGQFEIPVTLDANFIELEADMEVIPESIEYGSVPRGEDTTLQGIKVNNTGTVELQEIKINSSEFELEQNNNDGVGSGSSKNYTVTLKSVESSEGGVNVIGISDEGQISSSIEISGSTIKPVSEMKNELSSKVSDLRTKAGSEGMSQLTEVETQISSIQTSWDKGNYQEAQTKYQTAQSDLSSVEAQIQANSQSDSSETGGGQSDSSQQGSSSSGGGGGGIIIFIILLILVLGAGFVVYTSYYPEEGDPLYDVLGDREE